MKDFDGNKMHGAMIKLDKLDFGSYMKINKSSSIIS